MDTENKMITSNGHSIGCILLTYLILIGVCASPLLGQPVQPGFITTQVLDGDNGDAIITTATVQVYTADDSLLGTMPYHPSGDPYDGYYRFIVPDIAQSYIVKCLSPDSIYSRLVSSPGVADIHHNSYTVVSGDFFSSWNFNGVDMEAYPRQFIRSSIDGWSIPQKIITASAGPNGAIHPSGTVVVDSGDIQSFTILADPGYCVDSVIVDSIRVDSTTSYTFSNVTTDHTIHVGFRQATLQDGLVSYYPFNGNAIDSTGSGLNGTVIGASPEANRFGDGSSAYWFDGVDDYIAISPIVSSDTFSVSLWIRADENSESAFYYQGDKEFAVGFLYPNILNFGVKLSDGWHKVIQDSGDVIQYFHKWNHVVASYTRGEKLRLYVNKQLIAISPDVSSLDFWQPPTPPSSSFGAVYGSINYYKGVLDDVRFYARQLTDNDIGSLFHEGAWPPQPKYIMATAGPNGTIYPSDTVAVDSGGTQTFTFTPDAGYLIDSVLIDEVPALPTPSYTFTNVTDDHTIRVVFRKLWDKVSLTVSQSIYNRSLTFGLRPGAAYGVWGVDPNASEIDSSEGELEVPPPVAGIFDARFIDPTGEIEYFGQGSWVDVRNFDRPDQTDSFRVKFQRANDEDPVIIRWSSLNIAGQYAGPVTIGRTSGTEVDMKLVDSLVITNVNVTDVYIVVKVPNLPVIFESGWNLVSLPLDVEDGSVGVLFPGVSSVPFSFDAIAGYQVESEMEPGPGYWLKFPFVIQTQEYSGTERTSQTLNVSAGWNLIGSLTYPISVTSIGSTPPGIITGQFFGYDRGYHAATTLEPRKGYWVKVGQSGQLLMSTTGASFAGRIVIRPDGEMPPPPPGGASEVAKVIPTEYAISQNYPNPFNPTTTLTYALPSDGLVQLRVFNVLGQEVALLENEHRQAGVYSVQWDASARPSGIYFYKITAGSYSETKKMLLIR